jgi:hypothetical protein
LENLKRRDLSIDKKIILKFNFRYIGVRIWARVIWLKIGPRIGVI